MKLDAADKSSYIANGGGSRGLQAEEGCKGDDFLRLGYDKGPLPKSKGRVMTSIHRQIFQHAGADGAGCCLFHL